MNIQRKYSLKSINTFNVDAFSNYYVEINELTTLQELLQDDKFKTMPKLFLGGGSNILFTKNFEGIVIKINNKGKIVLEENDNYSIVEVAAGENWHQMVLWALSLNLGGLENLSLIPGNVGTAPIQNIGAYGVELKDIFHSLTTIEIATGKEKIFSLTDCEFGYRDSVFKSRLKDKYVIIKISLKLTKINHQLKTNYGAIDDELLRIGANPTIHSISQAVINIRESKLPDPKIVGNAGSFFKNPIVPNDLYQRLKNKYPNITGYTVADNYIKLAAGWLIETAGWKGYRIADVGVHTQQALVLVNFETATGKEIYDLSTKIIVDVYTKFNVQLEREVNII